VPSVQEDGKSPAMRLDNATRAHEATRQGTTVEWLPVEPVQLRVSRRIRPPIVGVEEALRIQPEQVLKLAYGQELDGNAIVVPLVPYRWLALLRVPVRVQSLSASGDHRGAIISVRWEAERAAAVFPVMEADLTVHHDQADRYELVLDGRYTPPLGVLGTVIDRIIGRSVAGAAAKSFLDRLGDYIEGA
jgi:hypothetical protein